MGSWDVESVDNLTCERAISGLHRKGNWRTEAGLHGGGAQVQGQRVLRKGAGGKEVGREREGEEYLRTLLLYRFLRSNPEHATSLQCLSWIQIPSSRRLYAILDLTFLVPGVGEGGGRWVRKRRVFEVEACWWIVSTLRETRSTPILRRARGASLRPPQQSQSRQRRTAWAARSRTCPAIHVHWVGRVS